MTIATHASDSRSNGTVASIHKLDLSGDSAFDEPHPPTFDEWCRDVGFTPRKRKYRA